MISEYDAKILIVDDTAANVLLLQRILKISGYMDVITLTDSRKALEVYLTEKPDLLLLDLHMPYKSGFQVLEELNEIKQDDYVPVIIITAQDDKQNHLKALELGAKDFIGKPFDNSEILMRIKNMLEMRMLHNASKMQNQILEEKVEERTRELQDLQIELIQRLLKATESRDTSTGYHIKRIGLYAFEMGKALGLSEKKARILENASMMHDIGKIGISDSILLKKEGLTEQEMAEMKLHTRKGGEILSGSQYEVIQVAELIAMTHHEKWDGSGYPNGLVGESIPLEGRITSICDVFDALVSERSYKPSWSLDDVISELKRLKGISFDPSLVDLFLENIPKMIAIKNQYS